MSAKFSTIRLNLEGEHFEILVHPDPALDFKMGKKIDVSQVVAVDEVYSDSSKGLRVPSEKLLKYFKTNNFLQIAEAILKKGDLNLTTEQRRRMIEDKRKQIISTIARNFVDPRTGLPHPPLRIEQAMSEIRMSIDPFRDTAEQTKEMVEALRRILPLKSEKIRLVVRVPPQFAPQSFGAIKGAGNLLKEEWNADGGLVATIEIPAGVHASLLERLGSITKGTAQATVVH